MSFKLLEVGMDALRRVRIGRAALVAATVCVATAPTPSWADKTISANTILTEDTDWSDQGTVTIADGVTLDLNGYALTVAAINGAGSIVDSAGAALASAGYERLEYIASDSQAQYIDTEDSHNASTIVDMRIQFNTVAPQFQAFYGARTGGNASQFGGWVNYSQFRYGYGGNSASNYSVPAVDTATIYDVHLNKSGQCTVVTNGVVADTFNIGSGNGDDTTLQLTDFLFAINQDGTNSSTTKHAQWHANAKIYSCVIRQNGGIAHNFIPVERLSDGKIGMYDSVTGKFHVSGNGKDFIGGAVAPHGLRLAPSGNGAASDFSGLTIGEGVPLSFVGDGALPANLDATKFASVEIADGETLDLNGHNLTVARLSGGPSGMLTDSANNYYTAMRDSSGNLYLQLEYLQSSGSQYIDTGYRHNANSVADMKVAVTVAPGNTWYCYYGSRTSEGNRNEFAGWVYKTHHWTGVAGAKGEQTSWSFTVNVPFLVHLDGAANATCSVDGHTFTHSNSLTDSGYNDNLFAGRQSGSNPFFAAKAAIYYCTIKEGETVKRDFVAAKRLSDGVLGMLDKENGVFYTNTGSGTFIAGGYAVQSGAAAFGSSGVLRIAVPANTTLSLDDMPLIVGDVKILKEGAGVLTYNEATSSQKYFRGGYEDHSAPLTAVWTGAAEDDDFDNADNWTCTNDLGNELAGAVPDATTTSYILAADADWTAKGEIDIDGATIDLAGHTLKAKGVSGVGLVSDTTNDALAFYKELTYLQSTTVGKQFIDTGYTHDTRANVRVKFSHPVYPSGLEYFSFFGGGERGYAHSFGGWMHRNGSSYNIYRSLGATGADWYGSSAGTVYNLFIRKSTAWDSGNCYVANEANNKVLSSIQKATASDWPSGTTPVTAYLFGHHNLDGTLDGSYAASRIYVCQISDAGTQLRNFVPMKHKVSGKPGMMDKVNNKFYTNANPESTEDFIAGPETAAAAPTATAAEIAAAGTFVIDVDEGDSVNLSSLKLYGKVKLVKTGLGTLVQDAAPECVCGIEVREGTFQTTAALSASIKAELGIGANGTVSIACAGSTSATMPATVSLEAGAKLFFDLTGFSAAEFTLASAGFSFGAGATADGCLVVSNPSYGATLESATTISIDLLTAPVIAVWTGLGEAGNFDDSDNWSCSNRNGVALSDKIPDSSTLSFRLVTDADWTAKGAIALGTGVTLDLNGHDLAAASITGDGVVTDTSSQRWTLLQDVSGNFYAQLEYLETGTSFNNQYYHVAEYINTGYQHNTKTVVDMKVQILKTTTDWFCYYGARNGAANEFSGWVYKNNHWKGVATDGDSGKPYPKNVPFLAHMEFGGTCTFGNVEDSSTYLSYTSGAGGSSGRNDFLFALNQGSGNQFGMYGRIFYCTVKEKTDTAGVYHMIRDFVPAQRLSDGVLGMLDKENGVFYVNNGSGAFIAGPYVTEGEATGAGELHITVAENATLSLANTAKIAGNVKIVKDGLGTLVAPTTGQYFVGGIDVTAGTLSMGGALAYGGTINAASGTTVSVPASVGSAGTSVVNIAGGTLAVANCGTSVVTGTVTLGGNAISVAGSFAPVSGTAAHTITLADGATLDFTQWTGTFPVAYPTLAYASGANITLKLEPATTGITALARSRDAETGKRNGYLLSWDEPPSGVTFSPDAATDARFRVVPDENGLRVSFKGGFCIIIK